MPYFHKLSGYRENWGHMFLGLAAPVVLWGAVVWAAIAYGSTPIAAVAAIQTPAPPATLQHAGEQDFVSAWARLDTDLADYGRPGAQAILQRVHDQNVARGISVCNFEWKQGQVSLVYAQNPGQPMGLDISNCADAVEKEESSQ